MLCDGILYHAKKKKEKRAVMPWYEDDISLFVQISVKQKLIFYDCERKTPILVFISILSNKCFPGYWMPSLHENIL